MVRGECGWARWGDRSGDMTNRVERSNLVQILNPCHNQKRAAN